MFPFLPIEIYTRSVELTGHCTRARFKVSHWGQSHYKAWWYANRLLKLLTVAKQHLCAIDLQCVCHNSCHFDNEIDRTNMGQFIVLHIRPIVTWQWLCKWMERPMVYLAKPYLWHANNKLHSCTLVHTSPKNLCNVASKWLLPYSAVKVLWTTAHQS